MRSLIFILSALLLFTGCQSAEKKDYESVIRQNTTSAKVYSGFHQAFEANVTAHNREVAQAILAQTAKFRAWDEQTLQSETLKMNDKRLSESHFFLRFYAPEQDYDDLHKPNSIWKVYLVLDGQKYLGKVSKDFSKLVELQTLYPHFDRFSTGYNLAFPVGRASLEGKAYSVLITSSLGQAEFSF